MSAFASCPASTTLVGGGYRVALGHCPPNAISPWKDLNPTAGIAHTNSPDDSFPYDERTWAVRAGGYPDFCFVAVALCAQ